MNNFFRALLLAPLFHLLPALAADDALASPAACPWQDDLKPVSFTRVPGPFTRTVDTDAGKQSVSVAMGQRVMLAYPGTDPFVNLKLERSVAGHYAADKAAIMAQLRMIERKAPPESGDRVQRVERGLEVVALNNRTLTPGVVSMVVWFDDVHGVIATAYLLNQKPERRAFQNFEEYAILRDRFIGDYTACMAAVREAAPPPVN
ncbi:hypothetical protein [Massilia sp. Leaf139]|uniref:hypothetical protein n=1 Tax=Massilia sp. Leaf139 TaxID=1736272 RepID=UPI0006FE6EB2|nr:hypothetical protein [Massilia sp. Leaf139]KQQ96266.1 hypothetical protein ASF77_21305 [Massilia sp. Leaf139]